METLNVVVDSQSTSTTVIAVVRDVTGAPISSIRSRIASSEPVALFDYSGNDIEEEVAKTKRLLGALDQIKAEYSLYEGEPPNESDEPLTTEFVFGMFEMWDEIKQDRERLDGLKYS